MTAHDAWAQLRATRLRIDRLAAELARRWRVFHVRATEHAKDLEPGRGSFFGRGATTWTRRQELWFQQALGRHVALELPGLIALLSRLDRVERAAAAQAARLRLNEPWDTAYRSDVEDLRNWIAARDRIWSDLSPQVGRGPR